MLGKLDVNFQLGLENIEIWNTSAQSLLSLDFYGSWRFVWWRQNFGLWENWHQTFDKIIKQLNPFKWNLYLIKELFIYQPYSEHDPNTMLDASKRLTKISCFVFIFILKILWPNTRSIFKITFFSKSLRTPWNNLRISSQSSANIK